MTIDQIQAELDKNKESYQLLGEILSKTLDTDLIHDSAFLVQIDYLKQAMSDYRDVISSLKHALNSSDERRPPPQAKLRLVKRSGITEFTPGTDIVH